MDDFLPSKRKSDELHSEPRKSSKTNHDSASSKMTFAERMMAKMGYEKGKGLGKRGDGILKPIEVVIRPEGVGVGAVKERSKSEREEARRIAKQRGQRADGDSDTETDTSDLEAETQFNQRRGKQKKKVEKLKREGEGSGSRVARPKYRTSADIEAAAAGLKVPSVLKSIIDATGPERRTLTSMAGLVSSSMSMVPAETKAEKLSRRAREDMERYVEQWNGLAERRRYISAEQRRAQKVIDERDEEVKTVVRLGDIAEELQKLQISPPSTASETGTDSGWETVTKQLEILQSQFPGEIKQYRLSDLAVASIKGPFRQEMMRWDPLENPTHLVLKIAQLRSVLGIGKRRDPRERRERRPHRSTTAYESLIYTRWLPKMRAVVTNEWDVKNPNPLLNVIESWIDVLPEFVYNRLVNDLIVQKLRQAIEEWNPKSWKKKSGPNTSSALLPHAWLFPWLPFISSDHLDSENDAGLVYLAKQKLGSLLEGWDLARGCVPGLDEWRGLLGSELDRILVSKILPRLARVLVLDFEVYPPDQDLQPLKTVLAWTGTMKTSAMAQLLVSELFPKLLTVLHTWLSSPDVNFNEVVEWYEWWKEQIPASVNATPEVGKAWRMASELMTQALDLEQDGNRHKLKLPDFAELTAVTSAKSSVRPSPVPPNFGGAPVGREQEEGVEETKQKNQTKRSVGDKKKGLFENETRDQSGQLQNADLAEPTFADIVMGWCDEEGLIMMPLRELHPISMAPLFRISASATARGGVLVYLKDDVVWAQNRKNKELWEPTGLGEELLSRAEGR